MIDHGPGSTWRRRRRPAAPRPYRARRFPGARCGAPAIPAALALALLAAPAAAGPPQINLARTSLAAVEASSVNGARAMDNPYYGVVNAFDNGTNRYEDLPYTYWLAGSGVVTADVGFDVPATVAAVEVEGWEEYSARLTAVDGSETEVRGKGRVPLRHPARQVRSVRFTFESPPPLPGMSPRLVQVEEIRILGWFPEGAGFRVERPRAVASRHNLDLAAQETFQAWLAAALKAEPSDVRETAEAMIYTYEIEGVPVFRVALDKYDSARTVDKLSPTRPALDPLPLDGRTLPVPASSGPVCEP